MKAGLIMRRRKQRLRKAKKRQAEFTPQNNLMMQSDNHTQVEQVVPQNNAQAILQMQRQYGNAKHCTTRR